jgi:hypothetical protein
MSWGRWKAWGSLGARRFDPRKAPREPVRPWHVPKPHELPSFAPPVRPGAGRHEHWTERQVYPDLLRFASEVLKFRDPRLKSHFADTGNVDAVVYDAGRRSKPCARFEVKSAQPYVKDVHARAGRRVGRYQVHPRQHMVRKTGVCDLFYVLVPVRDEKIEHVGICDVSMIERVLEKPLTTDIGIHRIGGFECPGVDDWVKARRAQERRRKKRKTR